MDKGWEDCDDGLEAAEDSEDSVDADCCVVVPSAGIAGLDGVITAEVDGVGVLVTDGVLVVVTVVGCVVVLTGIIDIVDSEDALDDDPSLLTTVWLPAGSVAVLEPLGLPDPALAVVDSEAADWELCEEPDAVGIGTALL